VLIFAKKEVIKNVVNGLIIMLEVQSQQNLPKNLPIFIVEISSKKIIFKVNFEK
jgi:hypothetical protein